MELVPSDELNVRPSFNFTPMIDFLFLMLSLFATLAISRAALFDTNVELAELKTEKNAQSILTKADQHPIHVSIDKDGTYKWLTEFQSYQMDSVEAIQAELSRQYKLGALPQDYSKTEVLLHIDSRAPWAPVAAVIFGVREAGFSARPVYKPEEVKK